MKNIILFILLFGMMNPVWSADKEELVAKCAYDVNFDEEIIEPGNLFFYILKIGEKFFAVNGIAHKRDDLTKKNQVLRGELPLLEISTDNSGYRVYYLPNLPLSKAKVKVPVPLGSEWEPVNEWRLTKDGDKFTISVNSGFHPFTLRVYPICSLWKWW